MDMEASLCSVDSLCCLGLGSSVVESGLFKLQQNRMASWQFKTDTELCSVSV